MFWNKKLKQKFSGKNDLKNIFLEMLQKIPPDITSKILESILGLQAVIDDNEFFLLTTDF